jgi:hypothetical protein
MVNYLVLVMLLKKLVLNFLFKLNKTSIGLKKKHFSEYFFFFLLYDL